MRRPVSKRVVRSWPKSENLLIHCAKDVGATIIIRIRALWQILNMNIRWLDEPPAGQHG
jgi:hypothetical protein